MKNRRTTEGGKKQKKQEEEDMEKDSDGESCNSSTLSDNPQADEMMEGSTNLGSIMSKILKTKTNETPVLSKRKAVERKLEEEVLERRARRLVRQELKEKRDSAHVTPDITTANYEKGLRKFATRGVVQLFNAVHQHQVDKEKAQKAAKEAKKGGASTKITLAETKDSNLTLDHYQSDYLVKAISKASFLELLKMGGASRNS